MRKQTIIAFLIFLIIGGLTFSGCRIIVNYLLAALFLNDRFVIAMLENFSTVATTAIFLLENFAIAGVVAIPPCIYIYQSKKINIRFVLSYSCILYVIVVFGVVIYLNLARSMFALGSNLFYVLVTPLFYVVLPIWIAYLVYYFYCLAHSQTRS